MKVLIINGPNLNMLGRREPEIYGHRTYEDLCTDIRSFAQSIGCETEIRQSNHEGDIVDMIQECMSGTYDALLINAGAYTHYSYAIHDAVAMLSIPTAEVHLTDIDSRDEFRKFSVLEDVVSARFYGKGFESYHEALSFFVSM